MHVDGLQPVAGQTLVGVEQAGIDVQHAHVVKQAGGGRGRDVVQRRAALARQMGAKQRHQDAVREERRPGVVGEHQVQADRLGQRHRGERGENDLAGSPGRRHAGEERPALDRRQRRLAQQFRIDGRFGLDAFVERARQAMRDQPLVEALVDRGAALEQLDALGIEDRLRGHDLAGPAELGHRLQEGGRFFAVGVGGGRGAHRSRS